MLIDKLFLTSALVSLLGVLASKALASENIPDWLMYIIAIPTITAMVGFVILAFLEIWL